ncbi:N-acetylneuraminate synthase [Pseudoalteromonas phenolica]|uniref:N-acetylneuraminate synthase n=1 Tax=Pseudoalteromonas phenolica TaxID=161398 RepID=UPI00110AC819|nr:N-acetylneuraminate synthase [Pseudoalteromonas phenolica]TMN93828.1 N-acetylneuraminate synthase [Pseudoalteromonas phenolica]
MQYESVFIIAEVGVNHNGSLELAKKLIDVAVETGADAVKFQTFITEEELVKSTPKAAYQQQTTCAEETQFEMVKKLELNKQQHIELIQYCQQHDIEFMSSPFDLISVNLLNELDVKRIKIPSGEITNVPFLRAIAALNKPVILSTGMAYLAEVEFALSHLKAGGLDEQQIAILHCTSEYPAAMELVNLNAMTTLKQQFGLPVGYSDHTLGAEVALASVALGGKIIEKHITLDNSMPGPDHAASSEPAQFKEMVRQIRNVEVALGSDIKQPTAPELATKGVVRKKIVARHSIRQGEQLTAENLTTKRSPKGVGAEHWFEVIGGIASQDYDPDMPVEIGSDTLS